MWLPGKKTKHTVVISTPHRRTLRASTGHQRVIAAMQSQSVSHLFTTALHLKRLGTKPQLSLLARTEFAPSEGLSLTPWPECSLFSLGIHALSDRLISNAAADVNQLNGDTEHACKLWTTYDTSVS